MYGHHPLAPAHPARSNTWQRLCCRPTIRRSAWLSEARSNAVRHPTETRPPAVLHGSSNLRSECVHCDSERQNEADCVLPIRPTTGERASQHACSRLPRSIDDPAHKRGLASDRPSPSDLQEFPTHVLRSNRELHCVRSQTGTTSRHEKAEALRQCASKPRPRDEPDALAQAMCTTWCLQRRAEQLPPCVSQGFSAGQRKLVPAWWATAVHDENGEMLRASG